MKVRNTIHPILFMNLNTKIHHRGANNQKNREIQQSIFKAQDQEPPSFFVLPTPLLYKIHITTLMLIKGAFSRSCFSLFYPFQITPERDAGR